MPDLLSRAFRPSSGQNLPLHTLLLVTTILTTTWAGAIWCGPEPSGATIPALLETLRRGVPFSCSLLLFLSVHEFGHYFAALRHGIKATLPYYIPFPPLPFLMSIGTLGALIRIRQPIDSRHALFDTGAAGPLAGFAVALALLVYGFLNLPPAEYIFSIHPEYRASGIIPPASPGTLYLGKNLLFILLETVIAPKGLPPMTEMYHYPFLFVGWLGCFVTALNLLPVGQLDGGHIVYALFGAEKHRKIAQVFLLFITLLGAPSFVTGLTMLLLPSVHLPLPEALLRDSWPGWIFWVLILRWFIGVRHPQAGSDKPLTPVRMAAGWLCVLIFILTFTPVPFGII